MGLFWGTWAALLPDIKFRVGATDGEFGIAMLGTGIGALPAMLVTGGLWRRLGWGLLPVTALAFAASALLPLVATFPVVLGVTLIAVGASSGAMDVAMNSAVSDVEVAADRRLMYGAHALFSLAVLVGSVVTGVARDIGLGPPVVLPAVALAMAAIGVGAISSVRGSAGMAPSSPAASGKRTGWGMSRAIFVLAVLCAIGFLIEDAIQNWSALHLERGLGATPSLGGAAPGIFAGFMFLGRSAGQWLGARFSDRALLVAGALLASVGLVVVGLAPSALVAIVGFALSGAGIALVAPALFARAGRMAGTSGRGAAIAGLTVFGYVGFVVGPVLMGVISQASGLPTSFLVLAALSAGLAAAGAVVLSGRRRARYAQGEELLKTGRV
jgi:predicted MFS family arabinose efflux permease